MNNCNLAQWAHALSEHLENCESTICDGVFFCISEIIN